MVKPASAPRVSASVGAAIRQVRAGRCSLAELARRSRTSVGILSLIERGRGNPSFETLSRIADALEVPLARIIDGGAGANSNPSTLPPSVVRGPWDDAVESLTNDRADSSMADGVTILQPGSPAPWRDSMTLRRGQEAVVLVRAGTVELTVRERLHEHETDDAREPLSVDISVRSRPFASEMPSPSVMELPPVGDPRWSRLIGGETPFRPTVFACQILLTHVTRSVKDDPSSSNVDRWVADLRAALLKYENLSAGELASVLG